MSLPELAAKLIHDAADESCRSPIGAVKTGDAVTLAFLDPDGLVLDAELCVAGDELDETHEMSLDGGRWFCRYTAPETPAPLWYCFRLHLADGELWLCADGRFGRLQSSRGDGFRLTVYDRGFETPEWFKRAVMYQIFPDRFARDGSDTARRGIERHRAMGRSVKYHESWDESVDSLPNSADGYYFPLDFFGGTLRGIEEKLPYLKSLGVTVLYLNPVFEACSNHRYDTADYMKLDPVLGSTGDFERLCADARTLGIHVMLDGVFSHTGADSVYFNRFAHYPGKGAYQGSDSPYYPWYSFDRFPDKYRCWWNFEDLPEVDEENAAWQDFVVTGENSVVKTWLRRGADGWRLDVADELPDDVLTLIRRAAKAVSPDAVVLGEVWEDPTLKTSYGNRRSYALGSSLDSVMNYPLRTALIDFFTFRSDARALSELLLSQRLNYPVPLYYSLMNLLGSHDTERIRTALATRLDARTLTREQQAHFIVTDAQDARGEAMQRLCAAVQFALPGVPCVYYGDENGMGGMLDPFCRAPFREGKRPLADWYAALAGARNAHPALSTGAAAFLAPDADVLCVLRFGTDGAFLCAVNRSSAEKRVVADLWQGNAGLSSGELSKLKSVDITTATCMFSGSSFKVSHGLADLLLPPETAYILELT